MSNEKIRVLCVITQSEIGGAQQFLVQLLTHLDRERFVPMVVVGHEGKDQLKTSLPADIQYTVARTLRRDPHLIDDIRSLFELRAIFKKLGPDILFLNSSKAGFNGSWAAGALPTRLKGIRVIYRIGGWTFNDPWPAWKKLTYRWMEKFSADWKDDIVVNNTHDLDQARALAIKPRGQLMRIYNGIDPYLELLPQDQARAALWAHIPEYRRSTPYDWVVGTIANFYPAKNLTALIDTATRISENVRFVIIGEGPQRAALEQQIASLGLAKRFFLVGSMSDAAKYLPAFDVFVLPSVKEGFPWSVLEAMAAKVPVVATRVGAVPEMIEDHKSGLLIDPNHDDQMAKAIIELLEDSHLRQGLAIEAHQQVMNRFSLRAMIDQYEKLFSQEDIT